MDTLDDVLGAPQGSLDDVTGGAGSGVAMTTAPSNINLAASIAAVGTPEDAIRSYEMVNTELNQDVGGSETAKTLLNLARSQHFDQTRESFIDLLADPTISDEDKAYASSQVLDINSEMYGLSSILSRAALEADTQHTNNEIEFTRVELAGAIQGVNAWREQAQKRVNQEAALSDVETMAAFRDVFEYFTPFVESKAIGEVKSLLDEGNPTGYLKAFTLLGEAKMDVRDMVLSIPPEERMPFTEALISMVNKSSNIVMTNQNDFARIDMLRTFLEGGYYTSLDKWIDTATSVLDLVGVGASVRNVVKGAKGADKVLEGEFIPGKGPKPTPGTNVTATSQRTPGVTLTGESVDELLPSPTLKLTGPSAETASSTRSRVQPASVSQVYRDYNNTKYRAAHEASMADESGETAQAMYGASRADVVAHDTLPEIEIPSGRVKNKVNHPDYIYQMSSDAQRDVFDYAKHTGGSAYFEKEKEAMRSLVVHDFEQVKGLTPRKEMFQIASTPDGVKIRAMFGPSNSGFSNPVDALESVKVAFRKYGLDDKDLILYARNGSEYEPVSLKELDGRVELIKNVKGRPDITDSIRNQNDFLVGVDYNYKFNPFDVTKWMETDVKYNLFDRLGIGVGSGHRGSFTRHWMDPASLFHPVVAQSVSTGVDKSAEFELKLLNIGRGYSDIVIKLPEERRALVEDYLLEANYKGIGFDYSRLVTQGFTPNEVSAMRSFRDYWDTVYWLDNADLGTTLRSQGYHEFIDEANDTKLVVKPLANYDKGARVYDPASDGMIDLSKAEVQEIYASGGSLARTKTPLEFGDESVDLVVAPNLSGKPYLRAITENSQVLNYREGYFPIKYKDRVFIDRVYVGKDGQTNIRAIETAGTIKDAKLAVSRLQAVSGNEQVSFRYRMDAKGRTKGELFEDDWNLNTARGLSSQKVRGKLLETSTDNMGGLEGSPILSPVDTMVSSIRSVSNRVSMRQVLDPYKYRTLAQYGEYLPLDRYGKPYIPSDVRLIEYRGTGQQSIVDLGAARSDVEYINYLENGYINDIDDVYKRALKSISYILGEAGNTKLEKAFAWASEGRGPTAMVKNAAFQMFIGTNPSRQIIVQSHQSIQLMARFPKWTASLRGPSEFILLTGKELGIEPHKELLKALNMTPAQADEMYKQWRQSGFAASVDKQNLLRGALLDLTDRSMGKGVPGVSKLLNLSRKVGFDAGETVNLMTSWLAHRDEAIRLGKDVNDLGVIEQFTAAARNFTYAMNAAGDTPYNQNALNLMLQYFQVPHKAFLTMTTNRQLTPKQKLRLIGFNLIMNPLPQSLSLSLFGGILPPDDDKRVPIVGLSYRDIVLSGLEGAVYNKILSMATGEETYINWSGLAPLDMYGMYDTLHGFATMSPGEVWANTPSGQIFAGQNPRFTNMLKDAAKLGNFFDEDFKTKQELVDFMKSFASLSSGMSNVFKARLAFAANRKLNTTGGMLDPTVTEAEAVFMLAGMDTRDSVLKYWMSDEMYNKSQEMRDDIDALYKEQKRQLLQEGITRDNYEFYSKVLSLGWLAIGNDNYAAKEYYDQLIQKDMAASGEASLYNQILDMQDVMSSSEVKTLINATPDMPDDVRANAIRAIDDIENAKEL